MFDVIKANVAKLQAKTLYPDNWMVLLAKEPHDDDEDVVGDIIFVGEEDETFPFLDGKETQEGYFFYIFRGNNLREFVPIEVVTGI